MCQRKKQTNQVASVVGRKKGQCTSSIKIMDDSLWNNDEKIKKRESKRKCQRGLKGFKHFEQGRLCVKYKKKQT